MLCGIFVHLMLDLAFPFQRCSIAKFLTNNVNNERSPAADIMENRPLLACGYFREIDIPRQDRTVMNLPESLANDRIMEFHLHPDL